MKMTPSLPWIVGVCVVCVAGVVWLSMMPREDLSGLTQIQTGGNDAVMDQADDEVLVKREVVLPEFPLASVTSTSGATFELTEGAETFTLRPGATIDWMWQRTDQAYRGSLLIRQGAVQVANDDIVGGALVLDMNMLRPADEGAIGLDSLLKGEQYFDVRNFPTASFVLESISASEVVGVLTLKGVARQIVFPASVMTTDSSIIVVGSFAFNLAQWGIVPDDLSLSEFFDVSFTLSFVQ